MIDRELTILIVDDEAPARGLIQQYLEGIEDVQLVGECSNGIEAVKAVSELHPDVMLLDIQMPKLDGFEVLELLDSPPAVIFTTAHEEFALKAFEVHALDYLLKPFTADRLAAALARVRQRLLTGETQPLGDLTRTTRERRRPLRRVLVRDGAKIHVIPSQQIDYIESQDDYVEIHAAGMVHRKKQPLRELEELLDPTRFVRVHRCYLLNVERLDRIEPYAKDSRIAILTDGTTLQVSRTGYKRLRELL